MIVTAPTIGYETHKSYLNGEPTETILIVHIVAGMCCLVANFIACLVSPWHASHLQPFLLAVAATILLPLGAHDPQSDRDVNTLLLPTNLGLLMLVWLTIGTHLTSFIYQAILLSIFQTAAILFLVLHIDVLSFSTQLDVFLFISLLVSHLLINICSSIYSIKAR